MSRFHFLPFKTGLVAVAGLLLASSVTQAAPRIVGLGGIRYGGVAIGRYPGVGYVRPGYYGGLGRGYGYGLYGRGYGYSGFGLGLGTGLGLGYGLGSALGSYGIGGYSAGYGSYGLGTAGYGYGVPGVGYGSYSYGYGYPATNGGYGVPPSGAANPYASGNPPVNPDENYPPPQQGVPQQPVPQQPAQEEQLPAVQRKDNTASVTVVVPEGTQLWFNGTLTTQRGPQRKFVTPALTPGEDFIYTVKARWMENGKPIEQTRPIHVQANSSQVIDFTK